MNGPTLLPYKEPCDLDRDAWFLYETTSIPRCMNHLLARTLAPPYQDGELDPPMPVTWRLIWKDDRYVDGTLPPEEGQSLAPLQQPQDERLRCEAGQPCRREGCWFAPARMDSRRRFSAGELMPDVGGDYGATLWPWDAKQ